MLNDDMTLTFLLGKNEHWNQNGHAQIYQNIGHWCAVDRIPALIVHGHLVDEVGQWSYGFTRTTKPALAFQSAYLYVII